MRVGLPAVLLALFGCSDGGGETERLLLLLGDPPRGRVDVPYRMQLGATGGHAPYGFAVASGALPSGIGLHPTGAIAGTPSEAGAFESLIEVRDAKGGRDAAPLAIEIKEASLGPLTITTPGAPTAGVGRPYVFVLEAEGGQQPYEWSIVQGALPEGLLLDGETGQIAGDVAQGGEGIFTVEVSDSDAATDQRRFRITAVPPPMLDTTYLPIAVVGQPYSASVQVWGGAWPLSVEIFSGTLPDGLTFSSQGQLSGTPRNIDTRTVRFRATDAIGQIGERRVRIWVVAEEPYEAEPATPLPDTCGEKQPRTVTADLEIDTPGMIESALIAVDLRYEDVGMVDLAVRTPSGVEFPIHVGAGRVGGGIDMHVLFERDRPSWGSFSLLRGESLAGLWQLQATVMSDTGFGCIDDPGWLDRFAIVPAVVTSSDDYLRVSGTWTNNLLDGPFARISGGGLPQWAFDIDVERWSTGANEIAEGGTGDDELAEPPQLSWLAELGPDVGTIGADGQFQSGAETGQGSLEARGDGLEIALPIHVVPPDWVP